MALNILGYLILLGSAPFSIAYLSKAKQENIHGHILIGVAKVLQFFYVFDVIAIMIMSLKENKWKKLTLVVLALLGSLLIVACIAIGVLIAAAFS
ncbi:MAG TPA: hypothetical protein IAC37_04615 [Candidatus Ventrimonas merdavium]|nr:hypothetical protein [Candidatus Ventrimonas merdavium]